MGRVDVREVTFPMQDHSVDRIFLNSVFTHMFPDAVMHYVREMRRVLKRNGSCLMTMYLVNDCTRKAIREERANFKFVHTCKGYEQCVILSPENPEGGVAYDEKSYIEMLSANGVRLRKPIEYGTWGGCGKERADGQDYVIIHPTSEN
jgi:hypothetical protein